MHCGRCGAEIPGDSVFCNSCGAKLSGEGVQSGERQALNTVLGRAKADVPGALTIVGSFLVILGSFLPWLKVEVLGFQAGSVLGLNMEPGAVVCAAGVFSLAMLALARSADSRRWAVVSLIVSAFTLALIFQGMYFASDNASIGAGLYISMVGGLGLAFGGLLGYAGSTRE